MKKFIFKLIPAIANSILDIGKIGVLTIGLCVMWTYFNWMIFLLIIVLTILSMIANRKD